MNPAQIAQLLVLAAQLVQTLQTIRAQSEATQDAVWAQVRADYADALAQFDAVTAAKA
jgi:hypothetical protein